MVMLLVLLGLGGAVAGSWWLGTEAETGWAP